MCVCMCMSVCGGRVGCVCVKEAEQGACVSVIFEGVKVGRVGVCWGNTCPGVFGTRPKLANLEQC